jgi:hypothetical protein
MGLVGGISTDEGKPDDYDGTLYKTSELKEIANKIKGMPIWYKHDEKPIGMGIAGAVIDNKLCTVVDIDDSSPLGQQAIKEMEEGELNGFSFGSKITYGVDQNNTNTLKVFKKEPYELSVVKEPDMKQAKIKFFQKGKLNAQELKKLFGQQYHELPFILQDKRDPNNFKFQQYKLTNNINNNDFQKNNNSNLLNNNNNNKNTIIEGDNSELLFNKYKDYLLSQINQQDNNNNNNKNKSIVKLKSNLKMTDNTSNTTTQAPTTTTANNSPVVPNQNTTTPSPSSSNNSNNAGEQVAQTPDVEGPDDEFKEIIRAAVEAKQSGLSASQIKSIVNQYKLNREQEFQKILNEVKETTEKVYSHDNSPKDDLYNYIKELKPESVNGSLEGLLTLIAKASSIDKQRHSEVEQKYQNMKKEFEEQQAQIERMKQQQQVSYIVGSSLNQMGGRKRAVSDAFFDGLNDIPRSSLSFQQNNGNQKQQPTTSNQVPQQPVRNNNNSNYQQHQNSYFGTHTINATASASSSSNASLPMPSMNSNSDTSNKRQKPSINWQAIRTDFFSANGNPQQYSQLYKKFSEIDD